MISKYEKTNGVKLFALVAVLAMVFAGAAVMMNDSVDAANEPTNLSGAITSTQEFGDGTEVVVDGKLTIPTGMALIISGTGKLTVESGATITIAAGGQLIFQQTKVGESDEYKNPTVIIDGTIVAEGTISDSYTKLATTGDNADKAVNAAYYGAIVNNTVYGPTAKTGVFLNGSITLERGAELWTTTELVGDAQVEKTEGDDTQNVIPIAVGTETGKLTVPNNGTAAADGQIVMGAKATLDISKRSSQISVIKSQEILMNQGATLTMNGHANDVVIKVTSSNAYYTYGSVSINSTDNEYTDDGNAIKETSNLTFTVTSQTTPALDAQKKNITVREYIVNIEGTVDAGDAIAIGAAVANGTYYKVTEDKTISDENKLVAPSASVTGKLTITDNTYTVSGSEKVATVTIDGYTIVSGTVTAQYKVTTGNGATSSFAAINVGSTPGTLYITGDVSLHINSIRDTANSNQTQVAGLKIVVDGGKMTLYGAAVDATYSLGTHTFAGAYTVTDETGNNSTSYFMDFATAVQEAITAGAEDVYAFAWGSEDPTTTDAKIEAGATVVDTQITIPADMILHVFNAMVVTENGELIFQVDSGFEFGDGATTDPTYTLIVEGKVTDNDYVMEDLSLEQFVYEVKKTTETETEVIDTYTSLAIALKEAQPNDEIQLVKDVVIESNMEIPADVTVITATTDGTNPEITINSAVLTVNGTLVIDATNPDKAVVFGKVSGSTTVGSIVVNNVIKNADVDTFVGATIPGAYFQGQIGEDDEGTYYVTSAAVASANAGTTGAIDIYGKLAMGDITFTQGENSLAITVHGEVSGNVTIAGEEVTVNLTGTKAAFTGSVSYVATAGTATVQFTAASGAVLNTESFNDGETTTTNLAINGDLIGNVTISAGSVNAGADLKVGYYDTEKSQVTTVASGATLNVLEGDKITVYSTTATGEKAFAGFVIDGTLNIDEGTITLGVSKDGHGQMVVNGTLNLSGINTTIAGIVKIAGTMNISEETGSAANVTFAQLYIGSAAETLGVGGVVTGPLSIATNGFVVVYPGADITNAAIDEDANGETTANVTVFHINGEVYQTVYSKGNVTVGNVIDTQVKFTGYESVDLGTATTSDWYSDEEMKTNPVFTNTPITSTLTDVYAKAEVSQALVYVSVGSNMTVYIDDVRYSNGAIFALDVGQHTISVQVNAGYTGETSVLVGGTAVTGGTFEITPQMAEDYGGTASDSTTSAGRRNGPHRDPAHHPRRPDRRHGNHGRPQADEELKAQHINRETRVERKQNATNE